MGEHENRVVLRIVGVVAGAMTVLMLIFVYFGSHFYFGSTVANVAVGGLSINKAEKKIRQETKQVEIRLTGENQTVKLQITSPYRIQKEYLKKNIRKGEFSLPYKKEAKEELIQAVNAASFLGGKEAKDAKIIYKDKKFQIIPEKSGTVVDSVRIRKELSKAFDEGNLQAAYDLADFYREPELTAKDLKRKKIPQKLETVKDRGIMLKLNKKKDSINRANVSKFN